MVEMTGNFIFNYLHDDDKKVFADTLGFELLPPSSPTTSLAIDLINSANNDPDLLDMPRKFNTMNHFSFSLFSKKKCINQHSKFCGKECKLYLILI
jgi:hypothetical protein